MNSLLECQGFAAEAIQHISYYSALLSYCKAAKWGGLRTQKFCILFFQENAVHYDGFIIEELRRIKLL